jgi:hypothetical protein
LPESDKFEGFEGGVGLNAYWAVISSPSVQICREELAADPFSGCVFIFRSRRGTSIRLLTYGGQGIWLAQKRCLPGRELDRVGRCAAISVAAYHKLVQLSRAANMGAVCAWKVVGHSKTAPIVEGLKPFAATPRLHSATADGLVISLSCAFAFSAWCFYIFQAAAATN